MGTQDVHHVVDLEKLFDYLRPKRVACSSGTYRELVLFLIWIRPDEIGHGSFVRYLSESVYNLDLVDGVDRRTEAAVNAKDAVVDDGGQGQEIKHGGEVVPDVCVSVLADALLVKSIGLGDSSGLVVPADEIDARGISQLETGQERDGLDAEQSTVHVVS